MSRLPPANRKLRPRIVWGLGMWLCLASGCQENTVIVGKLPPPFPSKASDAGSTALDAADGVTISDSAVVEPPGDAGKSAAPGIPQVDLSRYTLSIDARPLGEFCKGKGIPISSKRADATPAACEASIERRVFAYGLCACDELRTDPGAFLIDSFDSKTNPYKAGQTGGNVAVNSASLQLADNTQILGSLWVAGESVLALAASSLLVTGDLKTNATLHVNAQNQYIARDLWVAGEIVVNGGNLQVARDAYQAAGRSGLAAIDVAGQRRVANNLRIPAPCACQGDAAIDVRALVEQARDNNDNAAVSFDPKLLSFDGFATEERIVPCGRLYAPSLGSLSGSTSWLVSNTRTALFIAGDLTVPTYSTLFINYGASLQPTGELDLFIAGDINVETTATLALGFVGRPAVTRVFVAGQIHAQGIIQLSAELYAPNADFVIGATLTDAELYGAIYARKIQLPGKRFHYDRAILDSGETCNAPAPRACGGCNECPENLSCSQGSCQVCKTDADCCEPMTCNAGKCQILASMWP